AGEERSRGLFCGARWRMAWRNSGVHRYLACVTFERTELAPFRPLVEARYFLDDADDIVVHLFEVFGRDPVLEDRLAADLLHVVAVEERLADAEPRHVADARRLHVPVASNPSRIVLIEHRVEDRLVRESRWPAARAGRSN